MDIKMIMENTLKAQGISDSIKAQGSENVDSNKEEAKNPNETTKAHEMFKPAGNSETSPTSITKAGASDKEKTGGYFGATGITPDQQYVNNITEAAGNAISTGKHNPPKDENGTIKPKDGGWDKPDDSKKYPEPEGINETTSPQGVVCGVLANIVGK